MDKLYAPWRDRYVQNHIRAEHKGACVFCEIFTDTESDEHRFVLYKKNDIAVMLNLYPYAGGHLLVVPKKHSSEFYELSSFELSELMQVTANSMRILKEVLGCQGINFGANVGKAAGAGIPDHIHMHIVPRFAGDVGFFTTIGDSKQISVDLEKIYKQLQPQFKNLNS